MSEMSLDDERKHCKEVYENKKLDFVKRIVGLYAEGVAWKGCDCIDVDAMKEGVRNMLVTGVGDFKISGEGGVQAVSVPMPPKDLLEGESGHPFLWPFTQNAKALEESIELVTSNPYAAKSALESATDMANRLARDMCSGLGVPYELLGPLSAKADGDAIMLELITFISNVRQWRELLEHRLELNWNENWVQHGLTAYGQIYQVFKRQGIELRTLAKQVVERVKSARDNHLISMKTYEETLQLFLES